MKEDKTPNIEKVIIDGIIKEAEQDDLEFGVALKSISDEDFNAIIERDRRPKGKSAAGPLWRRYRPWCVSAVAAVLIILLPGINSMNAKLCEAALYASAEYTTTSRAGFDVMNVSLDELKEKLPELESRYYDCIKDDRIVGDIKEPGWDLTVAYLRLHKKGKAIKVLKTLSSTYPNTPFGDHCQALLNQLQ
ncbi:MAG: hypothetical protein ACI304_01205 [Lepagella sp.]